MIILASKCIIAEELGTVKELAQKTGLTSSYAKRILQCAMLSP
jgi:DNA-binding MarR family transcriptional regulator